jgi:hypothetical protein
MDTTEELLLTKGFYRLSGEKRAEILGMAKALTFAQIGNSLKAMASINTIRNVYSRDLGNETGYTGQRISAL